MGERREHIEVHWRRSDCVVADRINGMRANGKIRYEGQKEYRRRSERSKQLIVGIQFYAADVRIRNPQLDIQCRGVGRAIARKNDPSAWHWRRIAIENRDCNLA